MNKLQLSLIDIWFYLTKNGVKLEDYRLITPYWCNRFLLLNGEKKPKVFWKELISLYERENDDFPKAVINKDCFSFVEFTTNTMTLGYPSKTDTDRIIKFEHAGIEIRTGRPEWGAEPNKIYFVIKHGKRLN